MSWSSHATSTCSTTSMCSKIWISLSCSAFWRMTKMIAKAFMVAAVAMCFAPQARADEPPAPPAPTKEAIEKIRAMSPRERAELMERLHRFKELPPERQKAILDRASEYRKMTPEERDQVREAAKRYRDMAPRQRE